MGAGPSTGLSHRTYASDGKSGDRALQTIISEAESIDISFVTACYSRAVAVFADADGFWTRGKTRGSRRRRPLSRNSSGVSSATGSTSTSRPASGATTRPPSGRDVTASRPSGDAPAVATDEDAIRAAVSTRLLSRAQFSHIFSVSVLTGGGKPPPFSQSEDPKTGAVSGAAGFGSVNGIFSFSKPEPQHWQMISLSVALFEALASQESVLSKAAIAKKLEQERLLRLQKAKTLKPRLSFAQIRVNQEFAALANSSAAVIPGARRRSSAGSITRGPRLSIMTGGGEGRGRPVTPILLSAPADDGEEDMGTGSVLFVPSSVFDPQAEERAFVKMDQALARQEKSWLLKAGVGTEEKIQRVSIPVPTQIQIATSGTGETTRRPSLSTGRSEMSTRRSILKPTITTSRPKFSARGGGYNKLKASDVSFEALENKAQACIHAGEVFTLLAIFCRGPMELKCKFLYRMFAASEEQSSLEGDASLADAFSTTLGRRLLLNRSCLTSMITSACCVWTRTGDLPYFPNLAVMNACMEDMCDAMGVSASASPAHSDDAVGLSESNFDDLSPSSSSCPDMISLEAFVSMVRGVCNTDHMTTIVQAYKAAVIEIQKPFMRRNSVSGAPPALPPVTPTVTTVPPSTPASAVSGAGAGRDGLRQSRSVELLPHAGMLSHSSPAVLALPRPTPIIPNMHLHNVTGLATSRVTHRDTRRAGKVKARTTLSPATIQLLNTQISHLLLAIYISGEMSGAAGYMRAQVAMQQLRTSARTSTFIAMQARRDPAVAQRVRAPAALHADPPKHYVRMGDAAHVAATACVSLENLWVRIHLAAESPWQASKIASLPAGMVKSLKNTPLADGMNVAKNALQVNPASFLAGLTTSRGPSPTGSRSPTPAGRKSPVSVPSVSSRRDGKPKKLPTRVPAPASGRNATSSADMNLFGDLALSPRKKLASLQAVVDKVKPVVATADMSAAELRMRRGSVDAHSREIMHAESTFAKAAKHLQKACECLERAELIRVGDISHADDGSDMASRHLIQRRVQYTIEQAATAVARMSLRVPSLKPVKPLAPKDVYVPKPKMSNCHPVRRASMEGLPLSPLSPLKSPTSITSFPSSPSSGQIQLREFARQKYQATGEIQTRAVSGAAELLPEGRSFLSPMQSPSFMRTNASSAKGFAVTAPFSPLAAPPPRGGGAATLAPITEKPYAMRGSTSMSSFASPRSKATQLTKLSKRNDVAEHLFFLLSPIDVKRR